MSLAISAFGLTLDAACIAAAASPNPSVEAPENSVKEQARSSHLTCKSLLRNVLESRNAMDSRLRGDAVGEVIKLHRDIDAQLRAARDAMDSAFLSGAWREATFKKKAANLIGEMESVQMLNFISLAFLEGYDNPTGKVSASVRDSTGKMFGQLAHLMTELEKFEAATPGTSAARGG